MITDGLHPELSNEEHHADPAIGSSGLREIDQSPAHFWAKYRDPEREPEKVTPAKKLGTAFHAAILEPALFAQRYIALPEGLNRSTKEGKALYADIVATGREPIPASDMTRLQRMAASVHRHPVTRVLWDKCSPKFETSIFWTDPETGVQCKIRPDLMVEPCAMFPNGLLTDAKSTEDASPEGFGRSAWTYEMHMQAAFYPDGFQAHYKTEEPPPFLWLAAEKESPFARAYYSCPPQVSAYGRSEYRRLLNIYAECNARNYWPGYSEQVADLVLPAWAQRIMETDDSQHIEEIAYAAE